MARWPAGGALETRDVPSEQDRTVAEKRTVRSLGWRQRIGLRNVFARVGADVHGQ
jgi:hypothetical protein